MTKLPTRALFWDIDGTLLVTGRAGMIAWEEAFAAIGDGRVFPAVRPDGLTDHQIAAWLLGGEEQGRRDVQATAATLVLAYERALKGALPQRQGRVLDQALELLQWLRGERPQLISWLVTGNTLSGATAKLHHYGLSEFFRAASHGDRGETPPLVGSFSTRVEPRAHIVRRGLQMAQSRIPGLRGAEVLVIGDTPHDIEGAHAVGIPVLAVASNTHSLDDLAAHRPWRLFSTLPPPAEFAALLDATN